MNRRMFIATIVASAASACSREKSAHNTVANQSPDIARAETPREAEAVAAPPGMVLIPAGTFRMGSDDGLAHERPVHTVRLEAFYLDAHEVTNAEFQTFVDATGYVTEAEQWGWSIAFLPERIGGVRAPGAEWWLKVDGADWRRPNGPGSSIAGKEHHPVVQVSWTDAQAYCEWAGKRLPTEAEWEYAARGGTEGAPFVWGAEFAPNGRAMANTWQGNFPAAGPVTDGFAETAPVGRYAPNGYGLYDMAGNVWEWVADWYDPAYYAHSPAENPSGPARGVNKVMRGGSWMCADNYCRGYRVSHRNSATPDSGLTNTGFRCAKAA